MAAALLWFLAKRLFSALVAAAAAVGAVPPLLHRQVVPGDWADKSPHLKWKGNNLDSDCPRENFLMMTLCCSY